MNPGAAEPDLERECRAFTRLLGGGPPDLYVLARYAAAHEAADRFQPTDRLDALLVRVAASSPVLRRPAAAYARIFRSKGALQRKLVLLLSILESASSSYRRMDRALAGGAPMMLVVLVLRSLWWLGALVVGVLILGPMGLVLRGGVEP